MVASDRRPGIGKGPIAGFIAAARNGARINIGSQSTKVGNSGSLNYPADSSRGGKKKAKD